MNWTAILALLAVNLFLCYRLWRAEQMAERAHGEARAASLAAHWSQQEAADVRAERDTVRALHRSLLKRQSRTGQRAGETDNG